MFRKRTIKLPGAQRLVGAQGHHQADWRLFQHASQGREKRKRPPYLPGPVGGGESTTSEIFNRMIEQGSVFVIRLGDRFNPLLESPLGLVETGHVGELLETKNRFSGYC